MAYRRVLRSAEARWQLHTPRVRVDIAGLDRYRFSRGDPVELFRRELDAMGVARAAGQKLYRAGLV